MEGAVVKLHGFFYVGVEWRAIQSGSFISKKKVVGIGNYLIETYLDSKTIFTW
jgi:hypothetical protein